MNKSLKTCGSIFSGIGGWEHSCKELNLTPKFAFEFHQKYADTYKKCHGDHVFVGDVQDTKSNLTETNIDILFSSPPCQNYSVAKRDKSVENADARKDIGLVTIEIAKRLMQKLF